MRDATLEAIDTQIEDLNNWLDTVNDSLGILTRALLANTNVLIGDKQYSASEILTDIHRVVMLIILV